MRGLPWHRPCGGLWLGGMGGHCSLVCWFSLLWELQDTVVTGSVILSSHTLA